MLSILGKNFTRKPENVVFFMSLHLCMYVFVKLCLRMYVLVIYFILDSRGKELSFWLSACSVLIVVPLFKYVLISLWCLGRKVLDNCIDT